MTTLLLADASDSHAVSLRRCGPWARLLARVRGMSLDKALVGGLSPDSSPALSLRAHALISMTRRRELAGELRRLLGNAERPRHPFGSTVQVPHNVLLAREAIEELAQTLDCREPVDARGVAQVELLLRDGTSPLYRTTTAAVLRETLDRAAEALATGPPIHTDV
jgi:hypothetical protein